MRKIALARKLWMAAIALVIGAAGCNSPFVPKPRGFYAISLPEHRYQTFNQPGYPYQFEYPVYAQVVKDSTFFDGTTENPWWINIDFPQFQGRIYVSYKQVGTNNLSKLVSDAFTLTYKHSTKASAIEDSAMRTANGVSGVFFKVAGNAATANQFFLTDSSRHFLRGALYFDVTPNEDSLLPVNNFLLEDMRHLINTFQWKQQ